jgi:hypothetical protein
VATIDIHAVGSNLVKWDALVDDIYNQNVLTSLPSGLGLTALFDGSSETLTTTAAGVWAFTFRVFASPGADATIRGHMADGFGGSAAPFGPVQASKQFPTLTIVYALPSGAFGLMNIVTTIAAAANPYNVTAQLCISRLA